MKNRRAVLVVFTALLGLAFLDRGAFSQGQKKGFGGDATLASDPFKGVTTDGKVVPGLFSLKSTGVSTEPVRKAAEAFLAGLDEQQRSITMFPVDDLEWRKWNNVHRYTRQGISFEQMTEKQRELAFGMMKAGLSAKGLKQSQDVMKLNGALIELVGRADEYGEWKYHITVMGKPSPQQPWGWQLDGHHLIINYFVLGDQVVMTPTFMGSEPVRMDTGRFAGTVVLQSEERKGLAMIAALTEEQRKKAVLETSKTGNNSLAQAFRDNLVLDYAGLRAAELNPKQQQALLDLIGEYVGYARDGHAKVKMEEVRKHLDQTYFAWIGGFAEDSVFYYRIHSPVVLIEFDHQLPVALPGPRVPGKLHIHSLMRTPNGNDYGKDLLRQHYERSHGLSGRTGD